MGTSNGMYALRRKTLRPKYFLTTKRPKFKGASKMSYPRQA
jgi:hypothetical protein